MPRTPDIGHDDVMNAAPHPAIREAAGLAGQGLFAEASALGLRGLAERDDPVLHALVGALLVRLGDFAASLSHLRTALDASPNDVTVRANLVEALLSTGGDIAALDLLDEERVAADRSLRLRRLRAHLLQNDGNMLGAVDSYSKLVEAEPGDWASFNNLGNALTALGRFDEAAQVLARAARLAPDSAPVQLNYANALLDAGRVDDSEAQLRAAAVAFPADPNPLTDLFALYKMSGREEESLATLREAVARDPASAPLQSDLGQECAWRNLYAEAEASFERALEINPQLSPTYVGLASLYERMNREGELPSLLDRAVDRGADDETRHYIRALILKRAGRFDEAFAAMEMVGDAVVAPRRFNLRGQLLERLGRSNEAFEAFAEMNRQWAEDPSQPRNRAAIYRDEVAAARALLSNEWRASWTDGDLAPLGRRTPAFLVGFPRSGTTLLDTLLMGHPDVEVLEEEPFLAEAERDLGGPEALAGLTAAQLDAARAAYFAKVEQVETLRPQSLIVDKHPLHLNKIPLIRRMFPDAPIILALRHPCDVLLSCFITNFRLNNAMANFLDLNDAARLYDSSFGYFTRGCELLDPPVHRIVYERMIEDPRAELEPLMRFLELDWHDELLDHRSTAIARGPISTASYSQVTEPIYKRAAGRWERYRAQLEPVLPLLEPWVRRFGYTL